MCLTAIQRAPAAGARMRVVASEAMTLQPVMFGIPPDNDRSCFILIIINSLFGSAGWRFLYPL